MERILPLKISELLRNSMKPSTLISKEKKYKRTYLRNMILWTRLLWKLCEPRIKANLMLNLLNVKTQHQVQWEKKGVLQYKATNIECGASTRWEAFGRNIKASWASSSPHDHVAANGWKMQRRKVAFLTSCIQDIEELLPNS